MSEEAKDIEFEDLARWFSPARMSCYAKASDPVSLYIWDERLAKAYLEDVSHIEVLLRNFISERVAADCERKTDGVDRDWFDHPELYNLNDEFKRALDKVRRRLAHERKTPSYDGIVAGLSMDTWRFLLVKRLEPTVWRALRDKRNGGMPYYPGQNRMIFEGHVNRVYKLRNRCSHQEHLVGNNLSEESDYLDSLSESISWIAKRIEPDAADWILANSRVAEVRSQRP